LNLRVCPRNVHFARAATVRACEKLVFTEPVECYS
jgi:hypothetical protein